MNMSEYWASLPTIQDTESGIAAIEREQMTKPRPLDVEGPLLHQPCSHLLTQCVEQSAAPEDVQIDPLTRHTIELLQYSRKLREMIHDVKLHQDAAVKSSGGIDSVDIPVAPPLPELNKGIKRRREEMPLRYTPKDPNNLFARGFGRAPAGVDRGTCRRLLRQSIAAICAQSGYDRCTESALETLTDVTNEFYLQMTSLLRSAADRNAMNGHVGFPDVITRVFTEMGCGNITDLQSYYETRVVGYHDRVHHTCLSLNEEYKRLSKSNDPSSLSDVKTYRGRLEGHRSNDGQDVSIDEVSDVDLIDQPEGAGLDVSVGPDNLSNVHSEEDGSVSISGRWKSERTSTTREEHQSSSVEDKLTDSESHSAGEYASSRDFYRQTSDFTSPSFSDITSPVSNRGVQPALKKFKK